MSGYQQLPGAEAVAASGGRAASWSQASTAAAAGLLAACAGACFLVAGLGQASDSGGLPATRTGYFLQIADVHLDLWYNASLGRACFCNGAGAAGAGADARCARGATGNRFGQTGCDAPLPLVEAAFGAAAGQAPPGGYDWVLLTGDYTRHKGARQAERLAREAGLSEESVAMQARAAVRSTVAAVVGAAERFFPSAAVHHGLGYEPLVLGNNDFVRDYGERMTSGVNPWFVSLAAMASPVSLRGLEAGAGRARAPAPAPKGAAGAWDPLDDEATFLEGGYGMRRLSDDLYVISLNTVVYSTRYPWEAARPADPFGQLQWLERVLRWVRGEQHKRERLEGKVGSPKALITGHIPPSLDNYHFTPLWSHEFEDRYMRIVADHDEAISAQLFAHTHCDSIRLLPGAQATHPVFISSALSPVYGNNPSFRVWRYRGSELLDYTVYAAELSGEGPQEELQFKPLYSACADYGLKNLSAQEWRSKVVSRLDDDDGLWANYVHRLWQTNSGPKVDNAMRNTSYRTAAACAAGNARKVDFDVCMGSRARSVLQADMS